MILLLQQASSGDVQLLQTPYSASVDDKIATYLHQANGIPAFLSSITMELFNRQTMLSQTFT